ncbi:hypothetical protein RCL1_002073 [Eukaryota sp. TZLM3-RCL]
MLPCQSLLAIVIPFLTDTDCNSLQAFLSSFSFKSHFSFHGKLSRHYSWICPSHHWLNGTLDDLHNYLLAPPTNRHVDFMFESGLTNQDQLSSFFDSFSNFPQVDLLWILSPTFLNFSDHHSPYFSTFFSKFRQTSVFCVLSDTVPMNLPTTLFSLPSSTYSVYSKDDSNFSCTVASCLGSNILFRGNLVDNKREVILPQVSIIFEDKFSQFKQFPQQLVWTRSLSLSANYLDEILEHCRPYTCQLYSTAPEIILLKFKLHLQQIGVGLVFSCPEFPYFPPLLITDTMDLFLVPKFINLPTRQILTTKILNQYLLNILEKIRSIFPIPNSDTIIDLLITSKRRSSVSCSAPPLKQSKSLEFKEIARIIVERQCGEEEKIEELLGIIDSIRPLNNHEIQLIKAKFSK